MMGKIIDAVEEFFLNLFEKIGLKFFTKYYRDHKEGMRYLVFGGLTTIVNIIIFTLVHDLFNLSTTFSNVIAWIVAVIFAYITNKFFVFYTKAKDFKDLAREISSFFSARIFTLVIETIFLNIFIDNLGFNSIFMKVISNIIVIILNFVFSKIFIFKKENKQKEN
ncbi:MAG: GtrA family protein [Clostridia bacterium]|nr:GtrA family protein [Clostridia bacterium]